MRLRGAAPPGFSYFEYATHCGKRPSGKLSVMRIVVRADDEGPVADAVIDELRSRGHAVTVLERDQWPEVAAKVARAVKRTEPRSVAGAAAHCPGRNWAPPPAPSEKDSKNRKTLRSGGSVRPGGENETRGRASARALAAGTPRDPAPLFRGREVALPLSRSRASAGSRARPDRLRARSDRPPTRGCRAHGA